MVNQESSLLLSSDATTIVKEEDYSPGGIATSEQTKQQHIHPLEESSASSRPPNDDDEQNAHGFTALDLERHYTVFCILYMNGFLLHCRKEYDKNVFICLTFCGSYVVAVQQSGRRSTAVQQFFRQAVFLGFLVWCIYSTFETSPYNANHHNVMGLLSLVLLPQQFQRCWYWWNCAPGRNNNNSNNSNNNNSNMPKALQRASMHSLNVVRWLIVIMYFMAGFHKLNWDFLNPQVSCSLYMIRRYFELLGYEGDSYTTDLPLGLSYALPYMVLALEFVAPFLVSFASTQRLGLAILIQFHLILLPVGFADFGSIAMSLLWLFLHPATVRHMQLPVTFVTDTAMIFVLFQAASMYVWYVDDYRNAPWKGPEAAAVLFVYGILWTHVYRHTNHLPGPALYLPHSLASLSVLAGFLWYALNPYLGLRTVGVLSMFSNLRTEGSGSNHVLLGGANSELLRFWSYQDEWIELLDIDDRFPENWEEHALLPLHSWQITMQRLRRDFGDYFYVKLLYDGYVYESDEAFTDPDFEIFNVDIPYWQQKYFDYRYVQFPDEPQVCSW